MVSIIGQGHAIHCPNARLGPFICIAIQTIALAVGSVAVAEDEEDAQDLQLQIQPAFVMTEQQFDAWVYGNTANSGSSNTQLSSQIALRIEDLDRSCQLSADQKQKLALAGAGDVKNFQNRCAELKQKLVTSKPVPQAEVNLLYQQTRPLQAEWAAGVLGEASLFEKVVRHSLSEEQRILHGQVEAERAKFRYNAKVEMVVGQIENSMPLTAAQREKFIALLLAETQPPKVFGTYDYYVIMLQASKLPEAKLESIFDASQMSMLKRAFQKSRTVEQTLKRENILFD
jgi:hypothetical protein